MKNTITDRLDMFLAKIAGYDIDIKTMTPPTAKSIREKILLDIADKVNTSLGGGGVLECNATSQEDSDSVTLDVTAEQLFAAAEAGKVVKASINENGSSITVIVPVEAFRMANDDGAFYLFKARIDAEKDDVLFMSDPLLGHSFVELKPVTGE